MPMTLRVQVFLRVEADRLAGRIQRWLAEHDEVEVRFATQSEHLQGETQYVTVTLFYTEPTAPERVLQAHMRATAAADQPPG